jgi:hypothetical protein
VFSTRLLLSAALSAPLAVGCVAPSIEGDEVLDGTSSALSSCADPASGAGAVCDLGDGQLRFSVTLPSGQQYVEVFARQNGLQNVATNIVANKSVHANGTTTYSLVRGGYALGDVVEYRFYSYLPQSPGRFTPGPAEMVWQSYTLCEDEEQPQPGPEPVNADFAVTKDASLIRSSYAYGFVPDRNFGANSTVDVGSYHHESKAVFGYALSGLSSAHAVTRAELVIPALSTATGLSGLVLLHAVDQSTSWSESTVTWNNAPAATPVDADPTTAAVDSFALAGGTVNRLDVTQAVADAVANGETEVSFLLTYVNNNLFIDAKEMAGGQPTYLHVEAE